ncbi:MAG: LPP20 family lipoprotein, partial [Flavobacteriales bacterium]|nr:LPP20 family lipoprotein [Flavobacteriales bacterium]
MKTTRSRFTGLLLATTLLVSMGFSCRSGKDVASVPKENPRPEWMNNRPVSGSYYIGIGSASKLSQPLDYADIARKNALSDLAQGISVRVQGNTFLNSLEVNKAFSEEFISTISTSTDEQITDYEIAGQWEDKNEFWVYYRLSKAEYRAAKQARKDQAMRSAHDYYVKGLDAEDAVNIPAALDLYLHGLFALRDYWNEVNEFATDSATVFLDNELYSSIQRLASGIEITGGSPSIVLSSENNYLQAWEGIVAYEGSPAKGITVTSSFPGVKYQKPRAN